METFAKQKPEEAMALAAVALRAAAPSREDANLKLYFHPAVMECFGPRALLLEAEIEADHEVVGALQAMSVAALGETPSGPLPSLVDGDLNLWEPNAILRHLADKFALHEFYPFEPQERARVNLALDFRQSAGWRHTLVRLIYARLGFISCSVEEEKTARQRLQEDLFPTFFRLVGDGPLLGGDQPNLADLAFGFMFAVFHLM